MKRIIIFSFVLLVASWAVPQESKVLITAHDVPIPQGLKPPRGGYVPDQETAVRIAEAVLIPIYGEKLVEHERPFHAKLKDKVWTVNGTLHCPNGALCVGGTAMVQLSKEDGRILQVTHFK